MSSPAIGRSEAQPRGCKDTRAPSAPPRRLRLFQSRPPGRDPPPPFRLQNGGEGTKCRRPQKFFVPLQAGYVRPGSPPGRSGLADPERPQGRRGPGRTGWGCWAAAPCAADPSTPARAGHYLPRLGRFARPNRARGGVHRLNNPMRRPRGWGPRQRPRPARATPSAWGGTERRPRPSYPPLLHAKPVPWRSATNPNLHVGVSTSARPGRAKEPTSCAVLAYGRPGLLWARVLPRPPRLRLTFGCSVLAGSCDSAWFKAARRGGCGGALFPCL